MKLIEYLEENVMELNKTISLAGTGIEFIFDGAIQELQISTEEELDGSICIDDLDDFISSLQTFSETLKKEIV